MDDLVSLQAALTNHIAQNNAKFAAYDSLISHLTSTGATTMADGPVDNVRIHNHAPASGTDPNIAALMAMATKSGGDTGGLLGGSGGGLLGGLLLGSLLRNGGGLLGGGNAPVDGIVTPALLTSSLNQVQGNIDAAVSANERLVTSRFDAEAQRELQAAIERTAASTQLAQQVSSAALGVEVAKGQGEVTTQIALTSGNTQTQNALTSAATQTLVQKTSGDLATQVALGQSNLGMAIERSATASALAFKDNAILALQNTGVITAAIKNDGDLTRGLINSINDANLNRQLTTAQNEIIELRNDGRGRDRARETEINVTQNVNQAQSQAQQQQQFQTLNGQIAQLLASHQYLQQGIVNLGTMSGSAGQQTAANTRVN